MKRLVCSMPDLQVVVPKGLAQQLVFRVYSGATPIAYAQLNRGSAKIRMGFVPATDTPSVSYCLKNIEVLQNFRGQGIGSALLDEVIEYCQSHQVAMIYGEAKGDVLALKRWYRGRGFDISEMDTIRLSL
ncbi:MAG: GNAT family N-acetyltransferase [Pseudomonadales bacterium]|nr:GNAT family N-acetyltransferase [Pseudomonadales bacterium]